jgi:hypothetical protein
MDVLLSLLKNIRFLLVTETIKYHKYPIIQPIARPTRTPTTGVQPCITFENPSIKKNTMMIERKTIL